MCVYVCFCVFRGVDKYDHTQGYPLLCRENALSYVIYLPSSTIASLSTTTTPPRLACFPLIFEGVKNVPSWSSAQIHPPSRMVLPTPTLGSFVVFSFYAMSMLLLQRGLPWPRSLDSILTFYPGSLYCPPFFSPTRAYSYNGLRAFLQGLCCTIADDVHEARLIFEWVPIVGPAASPGQCQPIEGTHWMSRLSKWLTKWWAFLDYIQGGLGNPFLLRWSPQIPVPLPAVSLASPSFIYIVVELKEKSGK